MMNRRIYYKPRKKVYCIYTEGKKTEIQYFDQFKKGKFTVRCFSCDGKTKNVLQTIKNRESQNEADFYWVVLDVDEKKPENFDSLFEWGEKKKSNHGLAISNPCFEYWLLLHYEKPSKKFDNPKTCIDQLKIYIPDYNKDISKIKFSREAINQAVERAAQIESDNQDSPVTKRNGSTAFKLVKELI